MDNKSDPHFNGAYRNNLPAAEKSIYKEKGKYGKVKPNFNKKTNLGESANEVSDTEMKEKEFISNMKEYISSIVKKATVNKCVHKLKFYAIHVNYYYTNTDERNKAKYCPAEIGLSEFCLEKGVTRSYNKIINSKIRLGYAGDTRVHSNSTHQIPKEPDFGEKNYYKIFNEIIEFVKPDIVDGKLPPLFTLFSVEKIRNSVISVLDSLSSFDDKITNNFVVYSFEELFAELYNVNLEKNYNNGMMDEIIAAMYLKKDPFDYKSSLCCDYHQNSPGGNFCSTSIVKRWIFVLFSHVCSLLEIKLIPGAHQPIELYHHQELEFNKSFDSLYISEAACATQAVSANWNTIDNHTKTASERTYKDEEMRRAKSKPLQIVLHGSFSNDDSTNPPTSSAEQRVPNEPFPEIDLSEQNFPSMGRGAAIKRYKNKRTSKKMFNLFEGHYEIASKPK